MSFITSTKINMACLNTFLKKKPIFAAWHVTYRCNLQCKFCSFWKNDLDIKKEFTLGEFKNSIPTLLKLGIRVVNFAGGEPCIRNDLPQIVELFAKDFIVIINTNGVLITEEYATDLWKAGTDIVNVSLDFFDEEKHNYYRGGQDAYNKAIRGIKILNRNKTKKTQKVAIQAILSPQNMDEFEDMVKLAEELGVEFAFNPYRFGEHDVDMNFKGGDMSFLYSLRKKYKSFIATEYALNKTIEFIENGETGICGMGKYMIAIDPYGNVGPCENMMQHKAGNIINDSVETIYTKLYDIYQNNKCNKCLTRERSEVEPLYQKVGSPHWIKEAVLVKKS